MLKIKEILDRSTKDKNTEAAIGRVDHNRKSTKVGSQQDSTAKKGNFKKLSLAIATYYDSSKAFEGKSQCLSSKNDDAKARKLMQNKQFSMIDACTKNCLNLPTGLEGGLAKSRPRFEDKGSFQFTTTKQTNLSNTKASKQLQEEAKTQSQ